MQKAHLRASGGTRSNASSRSALRGASPRERRNPPRRRQWRWLPRRISARAEEPARRGAANICAKAHLRASGGTSHIADPPEADWGASPRERRNHNSGHIAMTRYRRISARAEEPVAMRFVWSSRRAHLRASGGTRLHTAQLVHRAGASPRERRNRPAHSDHRRRRGRISARAEEPTLVTTAQPSMRAHLRASGGTGAWSCSTAPQKGASPRERRNQIRYADKLEDLGRISARAEEPKPSSSIRRTDTAHLRASGGTRRCPGC